MYCTPTSNTSFAYPKHMWSYTKGRMGSVFNFHKTSTVLIRLRPNNNLTLSISKLASVVQPLNLLLVGPTPMYG